MIKITESDFQVDEVIGGMLSPEIGAIATYIGVVRGFTEGREVEGIEFDADETAIGRIRDVASKVREDFDIADVAIVHRIGQLGVGDKLLLIAVSACHRQPAFAACMRIIDDIKAIHADWSKEY